MFEVDWSALFIPAESLVEIVIRGTIIYVALFAVLRFLPRRTLSEASTSDILVIVLIADAVQNAMAGEYKSISEGLLLAGVILAWAVVIDWLDHRFPHWHLASGQPLLLIDDGKLLRENLRRQLITEDEVMSQLRQHGLDSPESVRKGYIEGDGHFTLLLRGGVPVQKPPGKRSASGA
jgi:uncharacterized membrane protein YcaP (DUF421 family)